MTATKRSKIGKLDVEDSVPVVIIFDLSFFNSDWITFLGQEHLNQGQFGQSISAKSQRDSIIWGPPWFFDTIKVQSGHTDNKN